MIKKAISSGTRTNSVLKNGNRLGYDQPGIQIGPSFVSTNRLFKKQWYLKSANVPAAWAINRGDRKIVVAILDTGFDLTHPDLNLPGKIVHPTDYKNGKKEVLGNIDTEANHGTLCAGVALAEGFENGIVGVANGCSGMPVRITDEPAEELMIKIFDEAARKADVISCSGTMNPKFLPLSKKLFNLL